MILGLLYGFLALLALTFLTGLLALQGWWGGGLQSVLQVGPGWIVIGTLGGGVVGWLLGLAAGLIVGFLIAVIVSATWRSVHPTSRYRVIISTVGSVFSGLSVFLGSMLLGAQNLSTKELVVAGWLLWVVLPALLASGWGWWTTGRVLTEVLSETT